MSKYRTLLMGGACCLGLLSYEAISRGVAASLPDTIRGLFASEPALSPAAVTVAEGEPAAKDDAAPAAAEPAPAADAPAPVAASQSVTQFYGIAGKQDAEQAWSADAAMNPDYAVTDAGAAPEAAAPAAESPPAAAEAPAVTEPAPQAEVTPADAVPVNQGVTQYYGIVEKADSEQAWSAEAAMNPDYTAEASSTATVPVTPAAEAPAAAEAAPPATGGQGVTQYYGVAGKPDADQPWSAAASVMPAEAAAPVTAEAAPAHQQAVEACRDALNAEVSAGKLLFGTASWDIEAASYKTLDKLAKIAKGCDANFVIEVGGHTDNTGKPESNKTLSELRAQEVVKYLVGEGVDAAKLKAVGYGQDRPVASNDNRDGRQHNRRIEFLVLSAGS